MRRAILVGWLALLLPLAAMAAAPGERAAPEGTAAVVRTYLVDRDDDRLADGLQAALAAVGPGERFAVVVTFSGRGDAAAAAAAVGPFDLRHEFRLIRGFAARMTAAQIRALAKHPAVFRIEEDFRVTTQLDAARADFGTDAARAEFAVSGAGIGVCIVDTGVDPAHEQLDGKAPIPFVDFVASRPTAYDDHGHGTHVASIAVGDGSGGANAARYRGVAPAANLAVAKVLDASGSGPESNVILGIEWCVQQPGVRVISLSLGSDAATDGSDALSQAVNAAVAGVPGRVVVAAAGNAGDAPGTVGSPAAATGAIAVAACAEWSAPPGPVNHSDGIYLAPWSSRGPTGDGRVKPDLCAPGVSITAAQANSSGGLGYVTYSGTSMATPFVAGTVALALERSAALTPAAVAQALQDTAQGRGAAGKDNDWGAGLLDGHAFLAQLLGQSRSTAFPSWQRILGSVGPAPARWVHSFSVGADDLDQPIAATIILDGAPKCVLNLGPLGCFAWEWSPDLDAELYDPAGNRIAQAGCMGLGECGSIGRQETLHAMPTYAGTYRIEVVGAQDSVNNGQGGSFALDLSLGPLLGAVTPPPDFALAVTPGAATAIRGGAPAVYTVAVTPVGSFSGSVGLRVSSKLPAGVSVAFNPTAQGFTNGQPAAAASTLTVTAKPKARRGLYTLTVSGTAGSLSHSAAVSLEIR